ncbi:MAG: hypothetical protein MHPSP_000550 [Paramarteilia canceri]
MDRSFSIELDDEINISSFELYKSTSGEKTYGRMIHYKFMLKKMVEAFRSLLNSNDQTFIDKKYRVHGTCENKMFKVVEDKRCEIISKMKLEISKVEEKIHTCREKLLKDYKVWLIDTVRS